jgi:hypothetical protein
MIFTIGASTSATDSFAVVEVRADRKVTIKTTDNSHEYSTFVAYVKDGVGVVINITTV